MKHIENNKISNLTEKLKRYKYYLLFFLLIFVSNEGFLFGVGNNEKLIKGKFFITIILAGIYFVFFIIRKKRLGKNALLIGMFLSLIVICSDFINKCIDIWTIWRVFLLLFSILIVSSIPFDDFKKYYINIMVFLSITSLITYSTNLVFPNLVRRLPITSNFIGTKFYDFLGINYIPLSYNSHYGIRNYGIFREPGVFSCYLGIGIILILFGDNIETRAQIKKLIALTIAMITTFSTSGILILVCIYLSYFFKKQKNKKIVVLLTIFIGVLFIIGCFGHFDLVFDKLFNRQSQFSDSRNDRFNGIYVAFDLIKRNPLLGIGITKFDIESKLVKLNIGGRIIATNNYTITLLKIFAQNGIFYFLVYMAGLYNMTKKITDNKIISIVSFVLLILIFSNEDFTLNILIHLLVFYGINYYKKKYRR